MIPSEPSGQQPKPSVCPAGAYAKKCSGKRPHVRIFVWRTASFDGRTRNEMNAAGGPAPTPNLTAWGCKVLAFTSYMDFIIRPGCY